MAATERKFTLADERQAQRLRERIRRERRWIDEHGRGAGLAGYVARYGDASDPAAVLYGAGGQAIYEADKATLQRLEDEYAALTGSRY